MINEQLQFKGGNPGAVQYGNFINYYKFHSLDERINLLPVDMLEIKEPYEVFDIGCNAGDLTVALKRKLDENFNIRTTVLAVDIDPTLIKRAQEIFKSEAICFKCLDIMDTSHTNSISEYLKSKTIDKFNVSFCFSITMWIHLNHGDNGLKRFLRYIASISEILVIEPQPWKCYKTAVKRMKQQNFTFPHFLKLNIKYNVEKEIENYLIDKCNLIKINETDKTKWERKIMVFKQPMKYNQ